jgi:hypothetical protein
MIRARCTILGPCLRETIVRDFIALDTQRVPDELGGAIPVVSIDACSRRLVMCVHLSDDRCAAANSVTVPIGLPSVCNYETTPMTWDDIAL